MRNTLLSLLLYSLCTPAVLAQAVPDSTEFNGKWNVSIQAGSDRPTAARLVLTNFDGTWYDTGAGGPKAKACKGKKFPITVQTSQAQLLEFTAWGTTASPACPNFVATLRPVNAKLLEGTLKTGEAIRLTRK